MENLINMINIHILNLIIAFGSFIVVVYIFASRHNRRLQELKSAQDELQRLSELKNSFLSNVSSEIHTQINCIQDMTKKALCDNNNENVRDYARMINVAGNMIQTMMGNIIDMARIEYDMTDCQEDKYHMSTLIEELNRIGSEFAWKRGLGFCLETDEGHPSELWGDESRIKQVVTSFLNNAVKYTDTGQITLRFSFKEIKYGDEIILLISVADTGIGINDENLFKLSDLFTRLDSTVNDGIGLGLFIAKKQTNKMKGQIFVNSEYGKGSEFWVEIPQKVVNKKPMGDWKLSVSIAE